MHDFDPSITRDFLIESGELLGDFERGLIELEASPGDAELLGRLFRALHTIKGGASFLNLPCLLEVAHAAETALGAAREGAILIGANETDLLLLGADLLKRQLAQLGRGGAELTHADPALLHALSEMGRGAPHAQTSTDRGPHAPTAEPGPAAPDASIRVDVARLETLMNLTGELVLQKNRLSALCVHAGGTGDDHDLHERMAMAVESLDRVTGEIQLAVMRTRLQPLNRLLGKYPRLVRDLAARTGKEIRLVIRGGDAEVDRSVIEALSDPLLHLLRNSADHGIEAPAERVAAGKDPAGTIAIRAAHEGGHVRVEISDDGAGLDRERIGAEAVERGMIGRAALETLSDEEVFRFILEPGFSTAHGVSELSGRGVGMDVVRTNIETNLRGSLCIRSVRGQGAAVVLSIPLTVAILPALMVGVGEEVLAIPLTGVTEIVHPTPAMRATIAGRPVLVLREAVCPLLSASEALGVPGRSPGDEPLAVVMRSGEHRAALSVSRVLGREEIIIKPLTGMERRGPISGATVRADGGVSMIIDTEELVRRSRLTRERTLN